MLGKALCLLLILQCVSADSHNSVDKIIDRIGDYVESQGPCNMPEETLNGYKVEDIKNKEYGMVDQARYKCNNGYKMVKTWKGDIGWCRKDGTFELPYCQTPEEYFEVEFKLVPGMSKMENAGRVKARNVYANGSVGEWYAVCDDNFNGPAAGAICRSMGFRNGKQVTAGRKMKPLLNLPFGKTNIYCYHDDTLIMSPSCNADEYGQMGWPLCVSGEQIAVQCFNETWKVNVGFDMVERSGKMSCPVKVMKEGKEMKLKKMDVRAKWGGIKKKGDGYETEYFKEGLQYTPMGKFSKKKGFTAKLIGNKTDYDCFFCNVYMGDNIMNPYPDRNHNCGDKIADHLNIFCILTTCREIVEKCYSTCKDNGITSSACITCAGSSYEKCKKCF